MRVLVPLRNKLTGQVRSVKVGFSWTCLLFGHVFGIPLFIRRLITPACCMLGLQLVIIGLVVGSEHGEPNTVEDYVFLSNLLVLANWVCCIVFGFLGNKMAVRTYLANGWVFADPDGLGAELVKRKWALG